MNEPKCQHEMKDGIAIQQTLTGTPDFIDDQSPITLSPGGPGKLIECRKCVKCGYSQTK